MKANALLRPLVLATGLLIGCAAAVWLVLWISLKTAAVRVPTVQGLELARAAAILQSAGLVVRMQDGVFDPKVEVGHVALQRPAPGFQLKRGGAVLLYPSLGKAAQRVPDLTNMPVSLAEAELEQEGLVPGRHCEVDGEADAAVVLASSPSAGAFVAPASEVALLVNREPRETRVVMPDFVGTNENDATRVLRALGFRLAEVQRVGYPGIGAGVVLRQDPQAGGPVATGAIIGLWVSR